MPFRMTWKECLKQGIYKTTTQFQAGFLIPMGFKNFWPQFSLLIS